MLPGGKTATPEDNARFAANMALMPSKATTQVFPSLILLTLGNSTLFLETGLVGRSNGGYHQLELVQNRNLPILPEREIHPTTMRQQSILQGHHSTSTNLGWLPD